MTVIDSDAQIARKWLVWSIDRASILNTDDVDRMAAEIAAAREAWGTAKLAALCNHACGCRAENGLVINEFNCIANRRADAVAALVEAAQNFLDGRHAADCQDVPGGKIEPWGWCECRFRYMRAALERVKG